MKRFSTLILLLTIMLTFTQKVTAFALVLNTETVSEVDCPMSMDAHMEMDKVDCVSSEIPMNMDCQIDCDFMTSSSVVYFVDHEIKVVQRQSKLVYQADAAISPYHLPESFYRPPFVS